MSEYDGQELIQAINKAGLMDALYANPKTKGPLLAAMKEVRPDLSIPEIDGPAAIRPELEAARREVFEMKAEAAKEKLKNRLGMDDNELVEFVTEMKRDGVSNVDTAQELRKYRE